MMLLSQESRRRARAVRISNISNGDHPGLLPYSWKGACSNHASRLHRRESAIAAASTGGRMTWKVLITDYVWPSTDPERAVLEAGGAEVVVAPDGNEATLVGLARDADAI